MSDEDTQTPYDGMPGGKIAQLRYSISNLWDDFGQTDSLSLALIINTGMILLGLLVFLAFDGCASYVGGVWALFNAYPIVQWVFGL